MNRGSIRFLLTVLGCAVLAAAAACPGFAQRPNPAPDPAPAPPSRARAVVGAVVAVRDELRAQDVEEGRLDADAEGREARSAGEAEEGCSGGEAGERRRRLPGPTSRIRAVRRSLRRRARPTAAPIRAEPDTVPFSTDVPTSPRRHRPPDRPPPGRRRGAPPAAGEALGGRPPGAARRSRVCRALRPDGGLPARHARGDLGMRPVRLLALVGTVVGALFLAGGASLAAPASPTITTAPASPTNAQTAHLEFSGDETTRLVPLQPRPGRLRRRARARSSSPRSPRGRTRSRSRPSTPTARRAIPPPTPGRST